jgi:DNA-binding response OmpR family regulator
MGGVQVHVCSQLSELTETMKQITPDLVVLEKKFVHSTDGDILKEIVGQKTNGRIPIMIAGYQFTKEEAMEVIRKGADELLLLPFSAENLSAKVSRLLHRKVAF